MFKNSNQHHYEVTGLLTDIHVFIHYIKIQSSEQTSAVFSGQQIFEYSVRVVSASTLL